jgi:chromate transport protein ChrA
VSAEEVEEIPVHRNGRISVQAIRTGHVVSTWQLQQSRYRRQTWTDRALVAVLMLGLGVSVSVVLFAGGFVFWMGMRAAEQLLGR